MSAIFISYTGRDPEGDVWADRLAEWCKEWNYGFFRDKDHSHGIKAGADWRASLYRQLGLAQALISLCTKQYEISPWCVGEVAIAVEKGKMVVPIHLANTREELKEQPLPLLLQDRQAIRVVPANAPTAEQLEEVKSRLQRTLEEKLNWRALQPWDGSLPPYPGLPAFEASQAPVFFGRDNAIDSVCERLASLALRPKAFLLLLGASGTGKSSLVRAGVVPKLRVERERRWLVLEPFKPGLDPFAALRGVLRAPLAPSELLPTELQSGAEEEGDLMRQLHSLSSRRQVTVLMVIDQFEELLSDQRRSGLERAEGERFLEFLEGLLLLPTAGVMVMATMRTDFLDPLQTYWPGLLDLATTEALQPIRPEDFGYLITGPATRSGLKLQPGLTERFACDCGSQDALPLLAFTLEKLWRKRQERGGRVFGPDGEGWDLAIADYDALGGMVGAVSHQAALCWNPATSAAEDAAALRQAFLDHLLSLNDDGVAAKRPARLESLPPRSRPIIQRLVDDRLLVSNSGVVEIAHEALLRTWEPLVGWIEEGRMKLEQRRRVRRLCSDLAVSKPLEVRLAALEGLLVLAENDPRAVAQAVESLASLVMNPDISPREELIAIQFLGLVGGKAVVNVLSAFVEQRQIMQPLTLDKAAPRLLALCHAAMIILDFHRCHLPKEDECPSWLLLPCATVQDSGKTVLTELVRLRVWAGPSPELSGAWFEHLGEGEALTMLAIPAGSFLMGSPYEEPLRSYNEGPMHTVNLDGFWISQVPITQSQWRVVMGVNPSRFQDSSPRGGLLPVTDVGWEGAMSFCTRMRKLTRRRYALPSEAQWEYACRSGTVLPFSCGTAIVGELANFDGRHPYNSTTDGVLRGRTTPVGQFPASQWGVQDMHGNVWEWCMDEWHDHYEEAPSDGSAWVHHVVTNSSLPPNRLKRGGSWRNFAYECRSAFRDSDYVRNLRMPFDRRDKNTLASTGDTGFRVVFMP